MAKAKKTKPRERLFEWRLSLIKGTPAKFIDFAYAPDAATAEKQVAEEHKISETLRDRLVAIRDEPVTLIAAPTTAAVQRAVSSLTSASLAARM